MSETLYEVRAGEMSIWKMVCRCKESWMAQPRELGGGVAPCEIKSPSFLYKFSKKRGILWQLSGGLKLAGIL